MAAPHCPPSIGGRAEYRGNSSKKGGDPPAADALVRSHATTTQATFAFSGASKFDVVLDVVGGDLLARRPRNIIVHHHGCCCRNCKRSIICLLRAALF